MKCGRYICNPSGYCKNKTFDSTVLCAPLLSNTPLAQTRGFVSDPSTAVGAPWEIYHLPVGPNSRIVDLHTKSGDLPGYSSMLVLIPDWDLGFAVLMAADPTVSGAAGTELAVLVSDIIADTFLTAVEEAAREQADATFSRTYKSTNFEFEFIDHLED